MNTRFPVLYYRTGRKMSNIFELTLEEDRDEYGEIIGVVFKFACAGIEYALFNPYHATGTPEDWTTLIDAIIDPKDYRTTVKIRGEGASDCDYSISIDGANAIFSTDYNCTGYQPAVDIVIPIYACCPAFRRMRQLVNN